MPPSLTRKCPAAMDFMPMCSSMLLERCTLQKLNSSDDDSEMSVDSGILSWEESSFDELDAYLHENPPGWSPKCECKDGRVSLCSFCLSTESFFAVPSEDSNRVDFLTTNDFCEPSTQSTIPVVDRLYPDLASQKDLVVLGVDLQALSSATCYDDTLASSDNIYHHHHHTYHQNISRQFGQSECSRLLTTMTKQQQQQQQAEIAYRQCSSTNWYYQAQTPTGETPAVSKPQRTRRPGSGRRATTVPDEEKIFPCPYPDCARVYSKNSHLRAHLRRHTGEKPFVCQWPNCKWRFSRSDELARHKRSHSGVKPYQCIVCGKRFGRSDHLAKHVRIHRKQGFVVPQKTGGRAGQVKVQILTPCK